MLGGDLQLYYRGYKVTVPLSPTTAKLTGQIQDPEPSISNADRKSDQFELQNAHASRDEGFFEEAKKRLAVMQTSSTCKRIATIKILTTCENLRIDSDDIDEDLETVQNLYAAHLAICELEGASTKLTQHCRLPLPSNAEDIPQVLESQRRDDLRVCIAALQSKPQWWTSYSNNRRDAYFLCKAMRPGFDNGNLHPGHPRDFFANAVADDYVKSLKNVVHTNDEIDKALRAFLQDIFSKNHEHLQFLKQVDAFHVQMARDLTSSAKEVSSILAWLVNRTNDASHKILRGMSTSFQGMKEDAEELALVGSKQVTHQSLC